jgi:hypothetical protein
MPPETDREKCIRLFGKENPTWNDLVDAGYHFVSGRKIVKKEYMKIIDTDPYNRVLAVVHLLGGQYGSADLTIDDARVENAIEVVLEIENRIKIKLEQEKG